MMRACLRHGPGPVVCLWLLAFAAGSAPAGAGGAESLTFQYRFPEGKSLRYRTHFVSDGTLSLPAGGPRKLSLSAASTVSFAGRGKADGGEAWRVDVETLRTKTLIDGREPPVPRPAPASTRRTLTVRPDGSATDAGGSTAQALAIVFPDRPLARGDTFTMTTKRPASDAGDGAPPLAITYTLAQTGASVAGYPSPVAVFEATVALAPAHAGGAPAGNRRVALKDGTGAAWFDGVAGILVRSKLSYAIDEESRPSGSRVPLKKTYSVRHVTELVGP
jgi:hypothetical protein